MNPDPEAQAFNIRLKELYLFYKSITKARKLFLYGISWLFFGDASHTF